MNKHSLILLILVILVTTDFERIAYAHNLEPSDETIRINRAISNDLPFTDRTDFELVGKGFIATLEDPIHNDRNRVVYDQNAYSFIRPDMEAPDSVNPSLWRQSSLLSKGGLFKVIEGIYQVRGFDISNVTFIEGETGWIVVDPLLSQETAAAALGLVNRELGKKPVKAIIYTHSHADHFGGVRGIVDEKDVDAGKIQIYAPKGFMEEVVSENILVGNSMSRRASYMYGNLLEKSPVGDVGAGLGMTISTGLITLIPPTHTIDDGVETVTIDGVELIFQNTPGAEAPAEMLFYIPKFKALCAAENINGTMHNVYTLRGAKVRDALKWSKYINETIQLFGNRTDVIFGSHHWPRWGKESSLNYLKKQRDLYRYIHDQTVRLINHGHTAREIAEQIRLPDSLDKAFWNRGYYGTLKHNSRAVYQFYLGWYDANPANLDRLPPEEVAHRYVDAIGGMDRLMQVADLAYREGDYRWAAELLSHAVFAQPESGSAKELLANSFEQLGYQSESGPWRNFYLSGAKELRLGVAKSAAVNTVTADMIGAMSLESLFDLIAIRLNPELSEGQIFTINFVFTDSDLKATLALENSVLNHSIGVHSSEQDLLLVLSSSIFKQIVLGLSDINDSVEKGEVERQGDVSVLANLFSMLDKFDTKFNIVTP